MSDIRKKPIRIEKNIESKKPIKVKKEKSILKFNNYKNKKSVSVPKEDWIIVKNAYEPIIDEDTWNIVSAKFKGRTKPSKSGEIHMFTNKVYCDCCKKNIL